MLLVVLTDFGSAPLSGSSKGSAAPRGGASQEPRASPAWASNPCQRATVPQGIPTRQAKPATGSTNSGSDAGSVPSAWPRQGADAQMPSPELKRGRWAGGVRVVAPGEVARGSYGLLAHLEP